MQASVPQQSLRKDGMAFLTAFQHQLCMRSHTTICVKSEDFPESWGIFIFVSALLSWGENRLRAERYILVILSEDIRFQSIYRCVTPLSTYNMVHVFMFC